MQMKIAALNRAIFLKDSDRASRLFDEIQSVEDGFTLRDPVQFQLAELLEDGQFPRQALKAYELGLEKYGAQKPRPSAHLSAGRISSRLEMTEKAFFHLERYMEGGGTEEGEKEARSLLSDLKKPTLSAESFLSTNAVDPSTEKLNVEEIGGGMNPPMGSPTNPIRLDNTDASMIQLGSLEEAGSSVKVPDEFKSGAPRPATPAEKPEPIRPKRRAPAPPQPPVENEHPTDVFQHRQPGPPTPETAFPLEPAGGQAPPRQPREVPPDIGAPAADEQFQEPAPQPAPPPPQSPPPPRQQRTTEVVKIDRDIQPADPTTPEESSDERYQRMLDGEFALLLPLGKKIKLDAVAELVAAEQRIEINTARKLVMRRKGLIYSELPLDEAVKLRGPIKTCNQGLRLVHVPKSLKPLETVRVRAVEFREQGMRLETNGGLKRVRWGDVRLVSSGLLGNSTIMTVVAQNPMTEYEFNSDEFSFGLYQEEEAGDRIGLAGLIKRVQEKSPDAVISSVSQKLLEKMSRTPQVFATREEFTAYTHYFLYHHFAEVVDIDELSKSHEAASDW